MAKRVSVTMQAADTSDGLPRTVTGERYKGAIILPDNPTWLGLGRAHAILAADGAAIAVADTMREARAWVTQRLAAGLPLGNVSRLNT